MKLNKTVKKITIIGSCVLIVTIIVGRTYNIPIVSTGVNTVLYPFEKGIQFISHQISNVTSRFKTVEELLTINEELMEEVGELRYANTILSQYKEENDSLKKLLDLNNRYKSYEGTGANVIGKDQGNWYKVFTIDKGLGSNINNKSVILAEGGLVGHVNEATYLTSKVISIIDSRSSVSAQVVRTGDTGIVEGDIELGNNGLCVLKISSESEVVKGDQIITSHLSSIYPPGILIGVVEDVLVSNDELVTYAHIRPVVDFKHLEHVLVIESN